MNTNHQLTQIDNYVRWFYLYNESELINFLSLNESCYLFLGDDFPECKYFIYYKHNKHLRNIELIISSNFNSKEIISLFKNIMNMI